MEKTGLGRGAERALTREAARFPICFALVRHKNKMAASRLAGRIWKPGDELRLAHIQLLDPSGGLAEIGCRGGGTGVAFSPTS